ncbi:anaerobic C4-dicarboxylate transporter, partial [Escherichia coli]|nr:anaerobic C4-dicarboxylate transporter [Escherichia coli]
LLFIASILVIVVIAMWPDIRTIVDGAKPISMAVVIQMMMLCFGGIILLATKTDPRDVPNGVVFKSGMVAAIAIFGIAWMSDTYFQYAM